MKFTVDLEEDKLTLTLASGAQMQLFDCNNSRFALAAGEIFLLAKKSQVKLIAADKTLIPKLEFDRVVIIDPAAYDLETTQLVQYLVQTAEEAEVKLVARPKTLKLPINIEKACAKAADEFLSAAKAFGIKLEKKKAFSAKAQHRWKKAISELVFHVDYKGCRADIIWEKATEMRIKKGATMLPDSECPRRADGSLGLPWTFTKELRGANGDKYDDKKWVTTEDVVLRSVNEVSYFLYFAGTNSWLLFLDAEGRSIHELTVVK
jgi:hypothetical protein